MISNTRLRKIAWAIAPIWLSKLDQWQQRRQRARQKYERQLDRLANPEAYEPESEPRTIENTWLRMTADRRPSWYDAADAMRADRNALHARIGRHGVTNARLNLTRR